jgi:hypothetical protein
MYRSLISLMPKAQPLLLDLFTNAEVAYSLRKLRTAYNGNCIRVRRSSDNAEQDIGFIGNDLDTASLLTFCGAGNAFVTTWYDQSGNSTNASIPTASLQAQIVTSGLIETDPFTGKISTLWTGDYYNFSVLSLTQNYLTTAVYSRTLTNDQMLTIGEGIGALRLYQWLLNGNTVSEITSGNIITHQTGVTTTGAYILTSLRDNSNVVKAFRNTTTLSTGTDSGVNISLRTWGRLGSFTTRGRMVEMVLFLNDKESSRADIVTNQNTYWNVY